MRWGFEKEKLDEGKIARLKELARLLTIIVALVMTS